MPTFLAWLFVLALIAASMLIHSQLVMERGTGRRKRKQQALQVYDFSSRTFNNWGTVTSFDVKNGFGFIKAYETGENIMIHASCMRACGMREVLSPGDRVLITALRRHTGAQAFSIHKWSIVKEQAK
jgi:cold shock CspA family protein